jgi:hypothetical protein
VRSVLLIMCSCICAHALSHVKLNRWALGRLLLLLLRFLGCIVIQHSHTYILHQHHNSAVPLLLAPLSLGGGQPPPQSATTILAAAAAGLLLTCERRHARLERACYILLTIIAGNNVTNVLQAAQIHGLHPHLGVVQVHFMPSSKRTIQTHSPTQLLYLSCTLLTAHPQSVAVMQPGHIRKCTAHTCTADSCTMARKGIRSSSVVSPAVDASQGFSFRALPGCSAYAAGFAAERHGLVGQDASLRWRHM